MKRILACVALCAVGAVWAACGGGSATPGADAPPTATPDAATPDAPAPDAAPPKPFAVNCTLVPAASDALLPAGRQTDGTAILPGGRRLTPAGDAVEVGGFPMAIRALPGGKHLVVTDGAIGDEYLTVVDIAAKEVVQREPFPASGGKALFFGLAVRADGHLFVSGGGSSVVDEYSYDPQAATPLARVNEVSLGAGRYLAGMAFVDDHRMLVADQQGRTVRLVDSRDGSDLGGASVVGDPYDIAVDTAHGVAYVSGWGTQVLAVLQLGSDAPMAVGTIPVGKNPEGMLLWPPDAPTKLLVAVADDDVIAVVDLATRTVETTLDVRPAARPDVHGVIPNALAVAGDLIFVASAGDDAVDVFRGGTWAHEGRIPTGWYPTAVAPVAGGLAIASAKGLGAGPYAGGGGDNTTLKGTIGFVATPAAADLTAGETQVEANNLRAQMLGPRLSCPASGEARFPLPPAPGMPTPIEHVVFIVRENKTYDANLGDLAGTRGDPDLAMYGEFYTPNLHALARAFTNGDNFYSNAEASVQGHQWTAAGTVNDFIEKGWLTMWGRATRSVTGNADRTSAPEDGYYFQFLERAGIPYTDYGEIIGAGGGKPGDKPIRFDPSWPGGLYFNLGSKDVDKAKYFADEVNIYHHLDRFTYLMLPNNHTSGLEPGAWTPKYMVADNDEGTGRVVDALSHSEYWPTTIVFIVEDDPSDGYDHIEAHRSTLVVASPWVKRGYVSSVHYDVPALWRTMELLLGLPPKSQQTATAPAMWDLFATTPDYSPFTFVPSNVAEERNPPAAKPSGMDFSEVDRAPGLGRVLWEYMMHRPPPYRTAGDADGDDD